MSRPLPAWICLLAALLLGSPSPAQQPPDSPDDTDAARGLPDRPLELSVDFESFEIDRRGSRIHIDYELSYDQWDKLGDIPVQLWFHLYVPQPEGPNRPGYSVTRVLPSRDGTTDFPQWIDVPADRRVELCLLGTTPGDNLSFGRGYFCRNWKTLEVGAPPPTADGSTFRFELQYRAGQPPYPAFPWFDEWTTGFEPPVPPGAELPAE